MKKYSICMANIMQKNHYEKDNPIIYEENALLLRFNMYNRYIDLNKITNAFDLSRAISEVKGVRPLKNEYYYLSSPYKYVDEAQDYVEIKNTNFIGVCKYIKSNKVRDTI